MRSASERFVTTALWLEQAVLRSEEQLAICQSCYMSVSNATLETPGLGRPNEGEGLTQEERARVFAIKW